MAKIETISGFVRSVDTDKKTLILAVRVRPPGPDTEDLEYPYEFARAPTDENVKVMMSTEVYCAVTDGVIRRLSYQPL